MAKSKQRSAAIQTALHTVVFPTDGVNRGVRSMVFAYGLNEFIIYSRIKSHEIFQIEVRNQGSLK